MLLRWWAWGVSRKLVWPSGCTPGEAHGRLWWAMTKRMAILSVIWTVLAGLAGRGAEYIGLAVGYVIAWFVGMSLLTGLACWGLDKRALLRQGVATAAKPTPPLQTVLHSPPQADRQSRGVSAADSTKEQASPSDKAHGRTTFRLAETAEAYTFDWELTGRPAASEISLTGSVPSSVALPTLPAEGGPVIENIADTEALCAPSVTAEERPIYPVGSASLTVTEKVIAAAASLAIVVLALVIRLPVYSGGFNAPSAASSTAKVALTAPVVAAIPVVAATSEILKDNGTTSAVPLAQEVREKIEFIELNAGVLDKLGKYPLAIKEWEAALRLDPNNKDLQSAHDLSQRRWGAYQDPGTKVRSVIPTDGSLPPGWIVIYQPGALYGAPAPVGVFNVDEAGVRSDSGRWIWCESNAADMVVAYHTELLGPEATVESRYENLRRDTFNTYQQCSSGGFLVIQDFERETCVTRAVCDGFELRIITIGWRTGHEPLFWQKMVNLFPWKAAT